MKEEPLIHDAVLLKNILTNE